MTDHLHWPGLWRACFLITVDNGGLNRFRSEEKIKREFRDFIDRRPEPAEILRAIDDWLKDLDEERLETVTVGEHTEMEEALKNGPVFTDTILGAWFDEHC